MMLQNLVASSMFYPVSRPNSSTSLFPADVACQRVKKKDHSVCLLEYSSTDSNEGEGVEAAPEKPLDVTSLKDLEKKKVKELKQILSKKFSDPCKGCVEKSDFINRIRKLSKPGEL